MNGVSRTNFTALVSSVFDSSVSSFLGPTVKNVTILTVVNAQPAAKRRTLESEAVIVSYLIQSFGASLTSSQLRAYLNGGKNNTSLTMVLEKKLLAQNFDSVTYALYSGITVSSNAVVEVVTPSPSASPTKISPSSAPAEVVAASAGTKSTPQDNTPYIVGPIVGVVGCILLSGIFFWCYRSRSNSNRRLSHSSVGVVAEDSHVA